MGRIKSKLKLVNSNLDIVKTTELYCIDINNKLTFIEYEELILCPFIKVMEFINNKQLYTAYYKEKPKTIVIKQSKTKVKSTVQVIKSDDILKDLYG